MSYISNAKFTVVPSSLTNPNDQYRIMDEVFGVAEGEKVYSENIESYGVKVLYKSSELPSVVRYLNQLHSLKDYNKLIAEYDNKEGIVVIALGEGEKLLIANAYKTADFGSAVYYILEALRQNQMNPQQTTVNLYAAVSVDELQLLEKYVKGVKVCAL